MNTLRRITRHAAKALAAGTVMAAAALPLIGVAEAGATTVQSYLGLTQVGPIPATADLGAAGVPAIFGAGWSGAGTVNLSSADAANLNGSGFATFSVTTSTNAAATGITFSGGAETGTTVAATISSQATAAAGYYNLTVSDSAGSVTISNAFFVDPAPTIVSVSPTTITVNQSGIAATLTGTGFLPGSTGKLINLSTGAVLGNLSYASATTMTGTLSATGSAKSGTFVAQVTNPDGGTASSTTVGVTVSGPSITSFSPTAIAIPASTATASTTTVTVNGTGFQNGAYVTTSTLTGVAYGPTTYVSATQVTFTVTVQPGITKGGVALTLHNPDGGTAVTVAGALGIGQNSSTVTPTVTAVSPSLTLVAPGTAQLTITGTGFGLPLASDSVSFLDTAGLADGNVTCTPVVVSDTQMTCNVSVVSGAISGPHSLTVTSGVNTSTAFAGALTVAGPTVTSVSPATVPAGFTGTYTMTGTGYPTSATTASTTGDQVVLGKTVNVTSSALAGVGDAVSSSVAGIQPSTTVAATATGTVTLSAPTSAWLASGTLTFTQTATATAVSAVTGSTSPYTFTYTIASDAGIVVGQTVTASTINGTATVASVTATSVTVSDTVSDTPTATDALTFTGTTSGSQTASAVVAVAPATGITAGQTVTSSAAGFPSGTITVSSVSGTNVTLSSATTAPLAASSSLSFGGVIPATIAVLAAGSTTPGTAYSSPATVTSATTLTIPGLALTAVPGDSYVLTVYLPTGTIDWTVPSVVAPSITGIAYASSTITGVGAGATGQTVYILGSGFLPGVTVTFPSASGLSATVSSVTPTMITLSVSAASSASAAYPTVTNTSGGSKVSTIQVKVNPAPTITGAVPASVVAGATATTITLSGTGFVSGATVTSSTPLLTITAVTWVSTGSMTFSASGPAINGTVNVGLTLTVTNPDGGLATTSFSINPQPTVTGVYYVPTFSTNYEITVTGTGFAQTGMTVTSSNTDYSVTLAAVNSTGTQAVLLVTTTSNATSGTSSNVTFTNPDGSTVSFKLNGGPVPTPAKTFTLKRVVGVAVAGRTRILRIYGTGFYGRPTVRSNAGGTRAIVIHDNGKMLTVRVTVRANVRKGTHVFTIILKNGQRNHINYLQR